VESDAAKPELLARLAKLGLPIAAERVQGAATADGMLPDVRKRRRRSGGIDSEEGGWPGRDQLGSTRLSRASGVQAADGLGDDLGRRAPRIENDGVDRDLEGLELTVQEPGIEEVATSSSQALRGGIRIELQVNEPDLELRPPEPAPIVVPETGAGEDRGAAPLGLHADPGPKRVQPRPPIPIGERDPRLHFATIRQGMKIVSLYETGGESHRECLPDRRFPRSGDSHHDQDHDSSSFVLTIPTG
jgi:hypothetical protein